METLFWILTALIGYVYAGYPVLLFLIRAVRGTKPVSQGAAEPAVTMIISAFNEEAVIDAKLRNSLSLEYPREALEIVVVSDASTDRTDEIVQRFAGDGVRLLRMPARSGKTAGLNEAVKSARGNVIVFSDANAMYDARAIRMLVRSFQVPSVGAVIGESRYASPSSGADSTESLYWKYEVLLKRLESQVGSVVGGDGAIYAIRKDCYEPMAADALSDFVNPLQIVRQGYRCVYEPAAFSVEDAAGAFGKEFRRKVRIVNRGWRATMSMSAMLNPLRCGLFAVELVSHKLLRWLVPMLLIALLAINVAIADMRPVYAATLSLQAAFYALALIGFVLARRRTLPALLSVPFYFCLVNAACLKGVAEAWLGKSYTTWTTARAD